MPLLMKVLGVVQQPQQPIYQLESTPQIVQQQQPVYQLESAPQIVQQ